jgi:hypothetical protein
MPAPDGPQFELYHGTAGRVKGGKLRPSKEGAFGPGVYSTPDLEYAEAIAQHRASTADLDPALRPDGTTTRPMFGTVYEIDDTEARKPDQWVDVYLNPSATKVRRAVSFPIMKDALGNGGEDAEA